MGSEKALLLSDTRRSISNTPSYLVNTPMCILGPQKYKTPAKIRTKVFRFVRTGNLLMVMYYIIYQF